jgi:hypothetical protein
MTENRANRTVPCKTVMTKKSKTWRVHACRRFAKKPNRGCISFARHAVAAAFASDLADGCEIRCGFSLFETRGLGAYLPHKGTFARGHEDRAISQPRRRQRQGGAWQTHPAVCSCRVRGALRTRERKRLGGGVPLADRTGSHCWWRRNRRPAGTVARGKEHPILHSATRNCEQLRKEPWSDAHCRKHRLESPSCAHKKTRSWNCHQSGRMPDFCRVRWDRSPGRFYEQSLRVAGGAWPLLLDVTGQFLDS